MSELDSDSDGDSDIKIFNSKPTKPFKKASTEIKKQSTPPPTVKRSRLIKKADDFPSLGLDEWICDNLKKLSLRKPTPVQVNCIPAITSNQNKVISASAPTGSGKTAAFALPILHHFARDPFGIYALVITPTRELALQIGEQFSTFGAPIDLRCEVIIGGVPLVAQQLALAKRPHIVVATPGRMASHILGADPPKLNLLRFLVLDESDRLLAEGEGYEKDLMRIAKALPLAGEYQVLLFSATSRGPKDVGMCKRLGFTLSDNIDFEYNHSPDETDGEDMEEFKKTSHKLRLVPSTLKETLSLIPYQAKHAYLVWFIKTFAPEEMIEDSKLQSIVLNPEAAKKKKQKKEAEEGEDQLKKRVKSMIIFTSTCEQCQLYTEMLRQLKIPSVALHAEMQQSKRIENLTKFRAGQVSILIATDVASRGLDIPQVDIVLNLDVPRESENYVHRIGRCARAGRLGRSYLFVTQHDVELVQAVESFTGSKLEVFEINDQEVATILHKASVAKRKAVMKLHDDGFMERLKVRKARRTKHKEADDEDEEDHYDSA